MRLGLLVVIFALLAINSVDAAERHFAPVVGDDQVVEYENGEAFIVARTGLAVVMTSFVPRDKKSALIKVGIKNLGDTPFNIADRSVTASSAGNAIEVMTYADRMKQLKRQEMWAGISAALAASSNNLAASNAGYQRSYGTYQSSATAYAYGPAGSARARATSRGSYSGSTYDASAAFQAQQTANAQNQAIYDRQQANAEFGRRTLQDQALKANTLSSGEFVLGDVQVSLPKRNKAAASELVITIDVAGELVNFRFAEQQ